uniref:C-factor n=1 Tax=Lygus hesperus TaxID=30085 RepID=A0A146KPM7_LYGHE
MKSMLITGANRGLGLGMIRAVLNLPKENVPRNIVAVCRKPDQAKELKELADQNKNIQILQLESKEFDKFPAFATQVGEVLKDGGLDLLINNAGVGSRFHRIGMIKSEELIDTYIVNTVAPIMLTKALLPLLKQAAEKNGSAAPGVPKAAIVNLSSILGSMKLNGDGGHYSYRCSKAALNAATISMKVDLKGTGICAVALHPGWVKTEMGGPKAPLEVNDACSRIVKTVFGLTEQHNGGFYDLDGKIMPW